MFKTKRVSRHKRIRKNVSGSATRPRVAVFRSTQHIYAQIINDAEHKTLVSASDLSVDKGTKTERAKRVGVDLAQKAVKKNIKQIVFDRGGIKYHGRVAALAAGLREGGLEF
jgi:large subunit ribosomal protein L18